MGIYKRPDSPKWWMLIERDGQRPLRRSTGIPHAGRSVVQERQREQDALEVYRCAVADLARMGIGLPSRAPKPKPSSPTFGAFVERHLVNHPYAYYISKLRTKWAQKPLHTITATDFETWCQERSAAGISHKTLRHELYVLKWLFAQAVKVGHLDVSPFTSYTFPRTPKQPTLRRLLTHAEETRLLAYLSPEDHAIFLVGQDALVRLGNILNLRWEDDLGTALTIHRSKNGTPYTPPISKRLRAALDRLPRTTAYLFPTRRAAPGGMRCWQQIYRTALARAARKAGITWGRINGRTFHWSTRRTGASRMLSRGADFKRVQKIGNWQTLKVLLEIYAEAEDEGLQETVELVGAADRRLRLVHSQSRDTHAETKTS